MAAGIISASVVSPSSFPTQQTYGELQLAYDFFNESLFDGKLPSCLITLQREKRTCGYFSAKRFVNTRGEMTDEIAMNPAYFAVVPIVETMQTLVHEMCHLWQHHFGTPGRGRYHNEQWAARMEGVGLMPSSTGQPGGKRTGDHMADYAIEGGRFLKACADLVTRAFTLSWYDRYPAAEHVRFGLASHATTLAATFGGGATPLAASAAMAIMMQGGAAGVAGMGSVGGVIGAVGAGDTAAAANKSNRAKYACACGFQVWGKPGLKILCAECMAPFEPQ
ncbi:SprT-like domain-containing protein [Variovorax sp. ZS18.2.2]|uniref:SprT-like domain-containing protein n=1 Tax=Variovorax sp. ZS18.2.2 TaxID=2971255 RepID=UPI00215076FD|nr:SprT-like domain-containing protein [Variovorax sp. ZS18.2.2]MCR6481001.1 SprT-like domain-containing protein [Variovorax sp. ZS18.2.2]